jgi:hypothetical protein
MPSNILSNMTSKTKDDQHLRDLAPVPSAPGEVIDSGAAEGGDAVFGHVDEDGPNYRDARSDHSRV